MATKMLAIISARLQLKGCDTLLLCFICNPSAMACFEVAMMDLTYRSTALEALVVRTKHPAVPPPGGSPQVWHRRGIGPPGIHNPNSGTRIHRACLTLFLSVWNTHRALCWFPFRCRVAQDRLPLAQTWQNCRRSVPPPVSVCPECCRYAAQTLQRCNVGDMSSSQLPTVGDSRPGQAHCAENFAPVGQEIGALSGRAQIDLQ